VFFLLLFIYLLFNVGKACIKGLRATCTHSLKVYIQLTTYNCLIYIYLLTYNLYDCLISTKIRWMWKFRTGTTEANKVKIMNIIRVKVVGKVLPEDME